MEKTPQNDHCRTRKVLTSKRSSRLGYDEHWSLTYLPMRDGSQARHIDNRSQLYFPCASSPITRYVWGTSGFSNLSLVPLNAPLVPNADTTSNTVLRLDNQLPPPALPPHSYCRYSTADAQPVPSILSYLTFHLSTIIRSPFRGARDGNSRLAR